MWQEMWKRNIPPNKTGGYSIYHVLRRNPHRLGVARCWSVLMQKEHAAAPIVNKVVTWHSWEMVVQGDAGILTNLQKLCLGVVLMLNEALFGTQEEEESGEGKTRTAWCSAFIVVSTDFRGWSKSWVFRVRSRTIEPWGSWRYPLGWSKTRVSSDCTLLTEDRKTFQSRATLSTIWYTTILHSGWSSSGWPLQQLRN